MADLFSNGLKYGKMERTTVVLLQLHPLYLAYQGKQVISIPQDPHSDSHTKRHLEIFSLFRADIKEQKQYQQGGETPEMCNTVAGRFPRIQEQPEVDASDNDQRQDNGQQTAHDDKPQPRPEIFRVIKTLKYITQYPDDDADHCIRDERRSYRGKIL
jgi:hypothetical protein